MEEEEEVEEGGGGGGGGGFRKEEDIGFPGSMQASNGLLAYGDCKCLLKSSCDDVMMMISRRRGTFTN